AVPAERHFRDHRWHSARPHRSESLEGVCRQCVSKGLAGQSELGGQLWAGAVPVYGWPGAGSAHAQAQHEPRHSDQRSWDCAAVRARRRRQLRAVFDSNAFGGEVCELSSLLRRSHGDYGVPSAGTHSHRAQPAEDYGRIDVHVGSGCRRCRLVVSAGAGHRADQQLFGANCAVGVSGRPWLGAVCHICGSPGVSVVPAAQR
ncbi:hypothetical protein IWW51_003512, partial [Coemansia sp. RSA 2702]